MANDDGLYCGFQGTFSISELGFKHFFTSPNSSQRLLIKKSEKRSIFYSAILSQIPHLLKYHSGWKSELRCFRRRGNDALRKLHFCSFKLKLPMMSHKVIHEFIFQGHLLAEILQVPRNSYSEVSINRACSHPKNLDDFLACSLLFTT